MNSKETVGREVESGFRTAGGWLLGFVWLGLVFAGLAIGFSPSDYPRALGWLCLAVAAAVLVATANHWVKAFPGIMAVATFNSLITILSGHATNNPSVLVPQPTAMALTALLILGTALSLTFRGRRVSVPDRLALLVLAVSVGWGAVDVQHGLIALAVGILCLFLAWLYDRRRSAARRPRGC